MLLINFFVPSFFTVYVILVVIDLDLTKDSEKLTAYFSLEDGNSVLFRNADIYLQVCKMLILRRLTYKGIII